MSITLTSVRLAEALRVIVPYALPRGVVHDEDGPACNTRGDQHNTPITVIAEGSSPTRLQLALLLLFLRGGSERNQGA
jgi:hypothetical protein